MKKLFTGLMLVLVVYTAGAQIKKVQIRGTISNQADTKILLRGPDYSILDSTELKSGKFAFNTELETGDARRYTLHLPVLGGLGPSMTIPAVDFFMCSDKVDINATVNKKSLAITKIKGAPCNDEYSNLLKSLPVHETLEKATAVYNKAFHQYNDVSKTKENLKVLKEAGKNIDSLQHIQAKQIRELARSKSANMMAAVIAVDYLGWSDSVQELESIAGIFDASISHNYYLSMLNKKIARLNAITIGQLAPDFILNDANGKPVSLASLRGQYVLLDFWASWCGPCRKENPIVLKAYEHYKSKNFTVLSVSLDDKEANWKKAVEEDKLPWIQLSDLKGSGSGVAKLYEITGIPANFLLNPEGKIIATDLRGVSLEEALEKLVK